MTTARQDALIAQARAQLRDAPGAVEIQGPDGPFWAVMDDFDVQVHGELPHFLEFRAQSWSRRAVVLTMAAADLGSLVGTDGKYADDEPSLTIEGTTYLLRDQPRREGDGTLVQLFLVEDDA